jgi:hypothetical protein
MPRGGHGHGHSRGHGHHDSVSGHAPTADFGAFDVYGFELSLTAHDRDARYACAEYARRREAKWEPFVRRQELPDARTLKRYARKGVPPALRGWVWWHASDAAALRAAYEPGHYQAMVITGEAGPCVRQIELVRFFL